MYRGEISGGQLECGTRCIDRLAEYLHRWFKVEYCQSLVGHRHHHLGHTGIEVVNDLWIRHSAMELKAKSRLRAAVTNGLMFVEIAEFVQLPKGIGLHGVCTKIWLKGLN